MNRPRLAGLRREVGEWRESGFRALIEPPEMELETLNLNNLKGHMAPPHPARGSDRWKNQMNWRRLERAP